MKFVRRVLELLQVPLSSKLKVTLEPPDIITHITGKIIVKRVLVCRDVEYSLEDLSEGSSRSLIESYAALLKSLPQGVHIHILKEEFNTEKFLRKLTNDILNTQVDLESISDEARRVKLQAKLHKLRSIYEALLKGKPFIKATLILTFVVSDTSLDKAKSLADYYETLISELFQKQYNLQLRRANRGEILKLLLESLGLSRELGVNGVVIEANKLSYMQPLVIDKPTISREDIIVGFIKDSLHPVGLKPKELYYHIAVIGPTGRGKSTLLSSIVEQVVVETPIKIFAIDFKGDLESYIVPGMLSTVIPEKAPLHFLKPPLGISHIDWRSVVLDAVSYVTSLPLDKISSALSSLEEFSSFEHALKSSSTSSLLIHFLEFVDNTPDYTMLENILNGNVLVSLKDKGTVFQNTYASLFIGFLRHVLLRENRDQGALVVIDDAWRILKLRTVVEIVREGRSKRVGVVISTQSPEDVPLEVLENIGSFVIFGSRNEEYIEKVKRVVSVNDDYAKLLLRLGIGEALYINMLNKRVELINTVKPLKLSNFSVESNVERRRGKI